MRLSPLREILDGLCHIINHFTVGPTRYVQQTVQMGLVKERWGVLEFKINYFARPRGGMNIVIEL